MNNLAWQKALRVRSVSVPPEEVEAGWPDALSTDNVAYMQYPIEGTSSAKSAARTNRAAMKEALGDAIESGGLVAERHSKWVEKYGDSELFVAIPLGPILTGSSGSFTDFSTSDPSSACVEEVTWFTITWAAFRDWLTRQGEKPSTHIQAWFDSRAGSVACDLAPAAQATTGSAKTQKERIEYWLSECEGRAKKQGVSFDRKSMPGKKAEFLALLHALDADLREIKAVGSLSKYLKQCKCTWPADAGTQESALSLYAKLFPEAKGLEGGVKAA